MQCRAWGYLNERGQAEELAARSRPFGAARRSPVCSAWSAGLRPNSTKEEAFHGEIALSDSIRRRLADPLLRPERGKEMRPG